MAVGQNPPAIDSEGVDSIDPTSTEFVVISLATTIGGVLLAGLLVWLAKRAWEYAVPDTPGVALQFSHWSIAWTNPSHPEAGAVIRPNYELRTHDARLRHVETGVRTRDTRIEGFWQRHSLPRRYVSRRDPDALIRLIPPESISSEHELLFVVRFRLRGRWWELVHDSQNQRTWFRLRRGFLWEDYA